MSDSLLLSQTTARSRRILVVDDDASIVQLIQGKLDSSGYDVLGATSGQQALDLIARLGLPHLAIVDLVMPGMDGFEFCRTVQQYADLPVIMLTAIDEEETRLKGIENFAEDFVTKPLSLHELVVRVERLLRRIGDFTYALAPVTQVDQYLAIDFFNQQVVTGDRTTPLTRIETKLLYILTHNAGRIVTTDSLLQQLWPDEETFEDALRVHIHRLRHKIEPDPRQPRYILTERGLGYSFPTCNVHRNLYVPA